MIDCQYHKPTTLAGALQLKADLGGGALFIAGGTDVMVMTHQKKLSYDALISLRHIPDMSGIEIKGDTMHLGAATTLSEILFSPVVAEETPILSDAVKVMGSNQMRNTATVGGNVMTAASSGDTLGPLLCLDAVCLLVSPQGERRVDMADMFVGSRTTAAEPDEILVSLEIPLPTSGGKISSGAFYKLTRRAAMDLALINVSAQLWLSDDRTTIVKARLAAGVAAPTPIRLIETEEELTGAPIEEALKEHTAARAVGRECKLRDSNRCSSWYREEALKVLLPRAASTALIRMGVEVEQV